MVRFLDTGQELRRTRTPKCGSNNGAVSVYHFYSGVCDISVTEGELETLPSDSHLWRVAALALWENLCVCGGGGGGSGCIVGCHRVPQTACL